MGRVKKRTAAACELCGAAAAVHCAADAAFLCLPCDAKVHGANFLASRHLRRRLAASGPCTSGSGSCVSTADSAAPSRRRARAEVVLEGWAKRMGLARAAARRRAAAAARELRARGPEVAAARVPLRVAMAAALWSELGTGAGGRCEAARLLRRLEASAHVPARLVLAVAAWMSRARRPVAVAAEEGWAECP